MREPPLGPRAARAKDATRRVAEDPCPLRTAFQRDRDRVIHTKAFRRLKHKTQVFISPEGDHYRTRLTHTLEVSAIGRTVARAMGLNEDLVEAITMGHDLGHAPFGHAGEHALDDILRHEHGRRFLHNEQSVRVVEVLERDGRGLNLTDQVRDGIRNHTGEGLPATLEGQIVRLVDRIAYVNHDIDDATRAGIITEDDLPAAEIAVLGGTSWRPRVTAPSSSRATRWGRRSGRFVPICSPRCISRPRHQTNHGVPGTWCSRCSGPTSMTLRCCRQPATPIQSPAPPILCRE